MTGSSTGMQYASVKKGGLGNLATAALVAPFLGADAFEAQHRERLISSLQRKAKQLGYQLVAVVSETRAAKLAVTAIQGAGQ